jgi:hypothetical protein
MVQRRSRFLLLGIWACSLLLGCGVGSTEGTVLVGGIQVNERDMGAWHRELLRQRFNTVALTVYARQNRWDSAELVFDQDELTGSVVREMRAAHAVGLRTVLVLRLALDHAFAENRFLWHGMVVPRTDAEVDAWFYRYSRFVEQWAEVAQREGVEVLAIGSELTALTNTAAVERLPGLERYYLDLQKQTNEMQRWLEVGGADLDAQFAEVAEAVGSADSDLGSSPSASYLGAENAAQAAWARQVTGNADLEFINRRRAQLESNWRRLIEEVRQVYSGKVTYAANFDQVEHVGFWDALDFIGVNAYFPLRDRLEPDAASGDMPGQFLERWREILARLDALRAELGERSKPVLVTELGYTSRRGSTLQPWAGSGFAVVEGPGGSAERDAALVVWQEQPEAPLERAAAIEALALAASEIRPPLLGGVLYWKLSTHPEQAEIEPFVVILGTNPPDPALNALRSFLSLPVSVASAANRQ